MIGYAFMGAAHSQAWRTAGRVADLPLRPEMAVVVGRSADAVAAAAAAGLGWQEQRHGLAQGGGARRHRPDRHLHAGRHPCRDRPRRPGRRQARAVREAAGQHRRRGRGDGGRGRGAAPGRQAMVGFTYRRTPAVALAREMVADGAIGTVRQVRAQYLQDWLVGRERPAHLATGQGEGRIGRARRHRRAHRRRRRVRHRPAADGGLRAAGDVRQGASAAPRNGRRCAPIGGAAGEGFGPVTVDDAAAVLRSPGVRCDRPRSRPAGSRSGRKNALRFEINGTSGSLAFDFEEHERAASTTTARGRPRERGSPGSWSPNPTHPYLSSWWPPGHGLGYEHGFTHQVIDLVEAIATGGIARPTFADGLHVQRVLAAVESSSADDSRWQSIRPTADLNPTLSDLDGRATKSENPMARPITLFTGQWADLPFEEVARLAAGWGYEGLEIACWGDHLDVGRGAVDDDYIASRREILDRHGLSVYAISNHLTGPGRLRRPDRRPAPRHPAGPGLGRRRSRGRAAARRRGDEGDRPDRGPAGRRHRRRLHRFGRVEVRRDVPAGIAGR